MHKRGKYYFQSTGIGNLFSAITWSGRSSGSRNETERAGGHHTKKQDCPFSAIYVHRLESNFSDNAKLIWKKHMLF